jgi:hypothetical protein
MGHMDQQCKNVRSTKKTRATQREDANTINNTNPDTEQTTDCFMASVIDIYDPTDKLYSDLTGRFAVYSEQGNLYVLVIYLHSSNSILVEPMKNQSDAEQLRAYWAILQQLSAHNMPKHHWMDNEASAALKTLLTKEYIMDYQLVLPHIHCRNAAERAICTFKNHFIAGLCSTHLHFPLRLWDKLLPQAEITLNLLQASRQQPTILAYEVVYGHYDYNCHPLMPLGSKIVVHEKPLQRGSWDPHGKLVSTRLLSIYKDK